MLSYAARRHIARLVDAGVDGEGYPLQYAVFDALDYSRHLLGGGTIVYVGRYQFLDRGDDHVQTVIYDWRKQRLHVGRSVAEMRVRDQS